MNCEECKEMLVGYVEGFLDESQKQAVAGHLTSCRSCRAELDIVTGLRERLVTNGKVLAQTALENDVMNQIVREQSVRLKTTNKVSEAIRTRRILMKNPIAKLAAAAVVVVAVFIGVHFIGNPFGTTVTFAQVIKPILNARTVVLDFIAGPEGKGPVIHDIVVGNRIRRTISNMETIMIIDLDSARMLTLDPSSKGAAYVDIKGPLQEGTKNLLEFVRKTITNLKDLPVQELGQQNIDGLKAIGFKASGPNEEVTIWADPKTALPIRIEMLLAQKSLYILKNIEFDVPIDESLVSMEVPADYTLSKTEVNLRDFTEHDFIEGLRMWAELLLAGSFPESISVEDYLKLTPLVGEKIGQLNVSEEEGTRLGMTFGRGMIFFQQLAPYGIDWHYAGKGVKLGDTNTPIFWYRPKDSKTYRVIYGDLHIKDVAPENLPK